MSHLTPSPHNPFTSQVGQLRSKAQAVTTILVMVGLALYSLVWLVQAMPSQAQALPVLNSIFYVTTDGTNDDLCTQLNPCALQRAVNLAADGDFIHVAAGTYESTTLTPTLRINDKSITVIGGFNSNNWDAEANPALNPTILDGGGTGRVVRVDGSAAPTIKGFTIQNGSINSEGAGVYIGAGSDVTLQQNTIANNSASGNVGGAIYVASDATATVISSTIRNNNGSTIIDIDEMGIITLNYNIIYDNNATGPGLIRSRTEAIVIGNLIYGNQANVGGGIYIQNNGSIINNTIVNNLATANGGGIFIGLGTGNISIINNIVADNTGDNVTGIRDGSSGTATIDGGYNNIFNNSSDVNFATDINADPEFINPANNNYRLTEDSPNINAGDPNTDPAINIDLDGNARPNNGRIDVGAYEFYPGRPNFSIEPEFIREFAERGTTAVYHLQIENIGTTLTDTYTFGSCPNDQGWTVICPADVVDLESGQAAPITVSVNIPAGANAYDVGTTTITATSTISPSLQRVAIIESVVAPNIEFTFTPNYTATLLPGDAITFTHQLVNNSDAPETFHFTLSSAAASWGQLLPANNFSQAVNPGATYNVRVRVQVPPNAAAGVSNLVEIVATSDFDATIQASVVNTVTASGTTGPRYVRPSGVDTDNNCTQPSDPCRTIRHAVGQAASGDPIRLTSGIHNLTANEGVNLNDTLHISGGWNNNFTAQTENPALTTIQRNDGSGRLFTIAPVLACDLLLPT
jgi:hypothetical protein